MTSQHFRGTGWACAVVGFLVLAGVCGHGALAARRPGPQSLADVCTAAEAAGLYWVSDRRNDSCFWSVVISERPIAWEQTCDLRTNNPTHPAWIGTVRVSCDWRRMMSNYDPHCSAVWGEFFVYGDPQLIELLTGEQLP